MIIVVAAVIEEDSRLLICQRRRDKQFPLKWEFPGGKVQSGELLLAALARELREELGVDAEVGREIYRTTHQYSERPEPFELVFFQARIAKGQVGEDLGGGQPHNILGGSVNQQAFEQVKWVSPAELPKFDFLEANAKLIADLANGDVELDEVE